MADLKQKANTIYQSILSLVSGNITSSLKTVQDGDGNNTALRVSTTQVGSSGSLNVAGNATVGGSVTAASFSGDGSALTGIGASEYEQRQITSNYTLTVTDNVILCNNASAITIALGAASAFARREAIFILQNIANVNLSPNGSEEINGSASELEVSPVNYKSVSLYSDGNNWWVRSVGPVSL